MIEAIEGMSAVPPTPEEVESARAAELAAIAQEFESTTSVAIGLSEWIGAGDWRLFFVHRDEIKKVGAADVLRAAKYYFKQSNRTVAILVLTDKPDRVEVPAAPGAETLANGYKSSDSGLAEGEAFDQTPANIEARLITGSLPDGFKLALMPKKTRGGTVVASITLNFGDQESLKNRAATALLVKLLLSRGTARHTAQQITDELNKLHVQITPNLLAPLWASGVTIRATKESFPRALELAAEMLKEPALASDEFQKFKGLIGTGIASQQSQPAIITQIAAGKYFNRYPEGDPRYAMSLEELTADIKAATVDDLRAFHDKFYGASNGEIVVIGDFDPDEVKKQALALFGEWKSQQPFTLLSQTVKAALAVVKTFETPDKPGASFYAATTVDISQSDSDYPAMVLANFIIGGGFLNSRLTQRIRQKDGLAYSVYTGISAALGLGGVIAATRVVGSWLYNTSPASPPLILGSIGCLLAVSAFASLLPARKAASIDP
ncbi:MAG TPA: insulinase family protein, partial [Blastocatellia bacterium]